MYDIKLRFFIKEIWFYFVFFVAGIMCAVIIFSLSLGFSVMPEFPKLLFYIFYILPITFFLIGAVNIVKIFNRIDIVKHLNQSGQLYKNLPYKLMPSGSSINGREVMYPVAKFKLPSGEEIELKGDARFDYVDRDVDGYIDLVIDPNDYSKYFLDFNINRLEGNRDSDFYKSIEELDREKEKEEMEQRKLEEEKRKREQEKYAYNYPTGFTYGNYDSSVDPKNKK